MNCLNARATHHFFHSSLTREEFVVVSTWIKNLYYGPNGEKMAFIFIGSSIHCQDRLPKLKVSIEPKNHYYRLTKMVVQVDGIWFHNWVQKREKILWMTFFQGDKR